MAKTSRTRTSKPAAPAAKPVAAKTPDEISAAAAAWDEARAELKAAGDKAAAAQKAFDTLPKDASADQRQDALVALEEAETAVKAAHAKIAALTPQDTSSEGAPASTPASPAPQSTAEGSQGKTADAPQPAAAVTPPERPEGTHTTVSERAEGNQPDAHTDGGAGDPAGPAQPDEFDAIAAELRMTREQLAESVRAALSGTFGLAVPTFETPSSSAGALLAPLLDEVRITVTGPKKGRWRAGFQFGAEPRTVTVTENQLELIDHDPRLTWEVADD